MGTSWTDQSVYCNQAGHRSVPSRAAHRSGPPGRPGPPPIGRAGIRHLAPDPGRSADVLAAGRWQPRCHDDAHHAAAARHHRPRQQQALAVAHGGGDSRAGGPVLRPARGGGRGLARAGRGERGPGIDVTGPVRRPPPGRPAGLDSDDHASDRRRGVAHHGQPAGPAGPGRLADRGLGRVVLPQPAGEPSGDIRVLPAATGRPAGLPTPRCAAGSGRSPPPGTPCRTPRRGSGATGRCPP